MKSIVIPTDFSENADNATRYALSINKKLNADVHLFHAYVLPVYATDVPVISPDLASVKSDSMSSLQKLSSRLRKEFPESQEKIHVSISAGYPETEIPDFSKTKNASLVIMGTTGASGMKETLFGTNTASVIGKLDCPLLVVPKGANFSGIKKIVFATNFAENDAENVEAIVNFARYFDSEVILLHISVGNLNKPFEYNSIETFCQRMKESYGYEKIRFKMIENPNVEEGIEHFIDEEKVDLLAMTNRHRSVFQKLFDRSLTRKVALHTHVPLMVFHVKERGNYFL